MVHSSDNEIYLFSKKVNSGLGAQVVNLWFREKVDLLGINYVRWSQSPRLD